VFDCSFIHVLRALTWQICKQTTIFDLWPLWRPFWILKKWSNLLELYTKYIHAKFCEAAINSYEMARGGAREGVETTLTWVYDPFNSWMQGFFQELKVTGSISARVKTTRMRHCLRASKLRVCVIDLSYKYVKTMRMRHLDVKWFLIHQISIQAYF